MVKREQGNIRTLKQKDGLETIIRINTSYLVEVTEDDLRNIKKYTLDNFIVNDLRTTRKLVEEGKSTMRKTTKAIWLAEEKRQFGE